MNRLFPCAISLTIAVAISACSFNKQSPATEATNQSAATLSPTATADTQAQPQALDGDLQPGQAIGTYTARGEVVELKYAYAGRAMRFGTESLVILVTDKPIPAEAVLEEIKSTLMLEGEQIRGLEYVIDDNGMWVRYHPGQYQESGSNKLKEYKVDGDVVRGIDDNEGSLSSGRYARSVKFVAAITK